MWIAEVHSGQLLIDAVRVNVKYYFTFPISRQIRVSSLLNHASLERLAYPDYSTFITERDISVFVFRVFYQNNVT